MLGGVELNNLVVDQPQHMGTAFEILIKIQYKTKQHSK